MTHNTDTRIRRAIGTILDTAPPIPDHPNDASSRPLDTAPRRRIVMVALATVAAVVTAAAIYAGVGHTPQPSPTSVSSPTPAEQAAAALTLFPVVDGASSSTDLAVYTSNDTDAPSAVFAYIARRTSTGIDDGISILATTSAAKPDASVTTEAVTLNGIPATRLTSTSDPAYQSIVFDGPVSLHVSGTDPAGFLTAVGTDGIAVRAVSNPAPGHAGFTIAIGALPAGYEVIRPPREISKRQPIASINVGGDATSAGTTVQVVLDPFAPTSGTATPIDINGHAGWISDTNVVSWEQQPGQYVIVGGLQLRDQILATARRVQFVDETTWRNRYHVQDTTITPAQAVPGS